MLKVDTALPNEPYREYKDVERVYSGSTEIDKILDKNGNVLFAVNKEVEGTPALTYKGKEETNLKNYRIYGQTVDGESVGDLITEGEHAGEYKVPVTVEGKNLLSPNIDWFRNNQGNPSIHDGGSTERIKTDLIPINDNKSKLIISGLPSDINFITYRYYSDSTSTEQMSNNTGIIPLGAKYVSVLLGGTGFNDETKTLLQNSPIQLEYGYTATPYEPYQLPVTTNLYLPEQIKMVGDEAEYVDYKEQKQHRVRGNLLNDKLSLNATLGTLSSEPPILGFPQSIGGNRRTYFLTVAPGEQYTISMSTPGDRLGICGYYNIVDPHEYTMENKLISDVVISPIVMTMVPSTYTFTVPNNVVMVAIYYSLSRKPIQIQIEKGSTATPYEPYIENTEVDVTLPELPTLSGTNTLTVGTEVQPSNVYLKGRIKEVS